MPIDYCMSRKGNMNHDYLLGSNTNTHWPLHFNLGNAFKQWSNMRRFDNLGTLLLSIDSLAICVLIGLI